MTRVLSKLYKERGTQRLTHQSLFFCASFPLQQSICILCLKTDSIPCHFKANSEEKELCPTVAMAVHQGINGIAIMPMATCVFVVLLQLLVMGKPVMCQETNVLISNGMPGRSLLFMSLYR